MSFDYPLSPVQDRIPEPPLDPPEPELIGYCAECHEPIYAGNSYYEVDDEVIEECCFERWAADQLGAQHHGY